MRNSSNWPNWLPCVQAHSGGPLGYNTICQTSHKILEGTYVYPPDFDQATKEILQECAAIHLQIPKSLVNTMIMKEDWGNHLGRTKEETPPLYLDGILGTTRRAYNQGIPHISRP